MKVPTHEDPGSGMPKGSDTAHGPQSSQWPQVGPLLRGKGCVASGVCQVSHPVTPAYLMETLCSWHLLNG